MLKHLKRWINKWQQWRVRNDPLYDQPFTQTETYARLIMGLTYDASLYGSPASPNEPFQGLDDLLNERTTDR